MLNLKSNPRRVLRKIAIYLDKAFRRLRVTFLNQGLLWIILWVRYFILLLIMLRLDLIPTYLGYPVRLPVWVSLPYLLYVIYLIILEKRNRNRFESQKSKAVQVLLDIFYIFLIYRLGGNLESDTFFFLLLPLLIACRYFSNKAVFGVVSLIWLLLMLTCFSMPESAAPDSWLPPPFQTPVRYILLLGIWALHYVFYHHVKTLVQIKATLQGEAAPAESVRLHPYLTEIMEMLEPLKDSQSNKSLVKEITEKLFARQPSSLKALHQAAVEIAAEQLDCESAAIFIVDKGQARRVSVTGISENFFAEETYKIGQGLTGKVFSWSEEKQRLIGEIYACNHVSADPKAIPEYVRIYKELLPSKKLEHLLVAPIEDDDGVYAIIRGINKLDSSGNLHQTGFSIKDREVLSIIALLVSCAWRQHTNISIMEQLIGIGEELAKVSPQSRIYKEACRHGAVLLEVEDCSIFVVDEMDEALSLVASTTIKEEDFEKWQISLNTSQDLLASVVREGKADQPHGEKFRQYKSSLNFDDLPSGYCHTLMLIPFFDHLNRCLGLIMIRNKNGPTSYSRFRQEDKKAAQLLASLLGSAIQGEILYERKETQRVRRVEILTNFVNLQKKVLARMQEPPASLREIADTAKGLTGAEMVCILPYYDNFQGIKGFNPRWVTVSQGWHGPLEINAPRPSGMTWRAINAEQGYILEEVDLEAEQTLPLLKRLGIRQVLGVPLKAQGYTFGVIFFDYTVIHKFVSEDIYLAKLIAGLTAQALMNAEYQSIKDLKEVRAINTLKLQENNLNAITDGVSHLSHFLLEGAVYARNRLDLALREQATAEETRQYIRIARGHIERLRKMTECILDYSRLRAEERFDELIELNEIVSKIIEQYQAEAVAKAIELFCSLEDHPYPIKVRFNSSFAAMVLSNLLSNALKHTPANGKIEVRYFHFQDKVYISVKDTGQGMSEETRHNVFRIPYRGKNQLNKAIKGTGLGLYFANQLLETSQGRIWVEETNPGKGTTITFELPIAEIVQPPLVSAS